MKNIKNSLFHLITILIFIISVGLIHKNIVKPKITLNKQDTALNVNKFFLSFLSIGNKRLLADLFWVITLLESDESHYKQKNLNSWMFLRFNAITDLDKNFLEAYQFGGQYLSIIKDDLSGAEVIFNKGLAVYPTNYELNLNMGFLQAFELQNYRKAVKHYEKIMLNPKAPIFINSIINKLRYSISGDLDLAYKLVYETYINTKELKLKDKLFNDLYSIKATIDLKCLNSTKIESCKTKDLNGNYYIKKGNVYIAPKVYKEYQIFKK